MIGNLKQHPQSSRTRSLKRILPHPQWNGDRTESTLGGVPWVRGHSRYTNTGGDLIWIYLVTIPVLKLHRVDPLLPLRRQTPDKSQSRSSVLLQLSTITISSRTFLKGILPEIRNPKKKNSTDFTDHHVVLQSPLLYLRLYRRHLSSSVYTTHDCLSTHP